MFNLMVCFMNKKLVLLGAVLLMGASAVSAQKRVTGRVVDSDGSPVIGATVKVDGTKFVTITDENGKFTLPSVPASAKHLSVSCIGMEPTTVNVAGNVRVVMKQNDRVLGETVVVGYGTARKLGTVVGSVAKVNSDKIENKPVANALDAMQGQVAGLQILSSTGDPGDATAQQSSVIRGIGSLTAGNTPLYVVDGAPTDASVMAMMNPNDIESVTVLKGASATSVYGSRAANGVIFVTTKRGRTHERARVTISQSIGWSGLARRVGNPMNAAELADFRLEHGDVTPSTYKSWKESGYNTDWQDFFWRDNAPMYQTNFSIQGGSEKTSYYTAASYYKQTGIVPGSKYKRLTFRSNIESQPLSWLSYGANVSVSYDERSSSSSTFQGSNYVNGGGMGTNLMNPFWNPYNPDGSAADFFMGSEVIYTPEGLAKYGPAEANDIRTVSSAYLQLTPVKGLTIKSQLSVDAYDSRATSKRLPSHPEYLGNGSVSESFGRMAQFTITNTVEYKFTLKDIHEIVLLAGQEGIRSTSESFGASGSGQSSDYVATLGNALESTLPSSGWSKYEYLSFFGRVDYSLMNKYFFNLTVRNDASSRFGTNNQAATFVSGGVMWNAKLEDFLKDVSWLTSLQIRADVGSTGNSSIGNYDHLSLVSNGQYGLNFAFGLPSLGNESLKWEKQIQTSVGFDARLFDRFDLGVAYYTRKTKDMLMSVPLAYSTGYGSVMQNVGEMTNNGVEISFGLDIIKRRDMSLRVYGNYTYNNNTIDKLFNGLQEWPMSAYLTSYIVGKSLNFYMPVFAGVDKMTGEQMWYKKGCVGDVVSDFNPETMTKEFNEDELSQDTGKKRYAPHNGGFGLSFSWKGISLSADFAYSLGKYMVNNDAFFYMNTYDMPYYYNQSKDMFDIWEKVGDVTVHPAYGTPREFDTHLLENASFMRLKNLSLSYDLPKQWMEATHFLKNVRITATARNVFTVTKYSGIDPEINSNITLGAFPNTREYTIGAEVTF